MDGQEGNNRDLIFIRPVLVINDGNEMGILGTELNQKLCYF